MLGDYIKMFNQYSIEKKALTISTEIPYFCEKYYYDETKKCRRYYEKISGEEYVDGLYQCPYGFSCYKCNGRIYSCLIVVGNSDLSKVNVHLKTYKQSIKDFSQYTINQLRMIIRDNEELEHKQKILRLTIHDLKNMAKHFMDLTESVKQDADLVKKIEQDDELFSAIEGYSLIQYRLDYHDQLLNNEGIYGNEKRNVNFHKMIMKLSKLMQYRGHKKDVSIEFHGYTNNKFWCSRDMYLASFIFIENAIKYAEQFSIINIYFNDRGRNTTEVKITNACKTVSASEMEKIYNDGFRGGQAQMTSKGSGLGLGLAKKICERSGVELKTEFHENDSNKGEFVVDLYIQKDIVEKM